MESTKSEIVKDPELFYKDGSFKFLSWLLNYDALVSLYLQV